MSYLIPWKIKKTMMFLGAEQSVFRLFQVNNDRALHHWSPPTPTSCGGVAASFVGTGVTICLHLCKFTVRLCVCVCVLAASRLRAECQVAPLHGAAPFGGENEQCCSAPPQDFCSTTGGKHRGDVGKVGGEEHAARCEPHFSCRCPRSGGTAVCVPTRI